MAGKPPTLERTLADMQSWPSSWEIDDDRAAGEALVAALTPFVRHLYETDVATTTLRRHVNNLWILGGEVIRQRHDDNETDDVPSLAEVVDEEGGPLLYSMDEAEQRPFDATCRALHRFLTKPAGKRVIATRRRTPSSAISFVKKAQLDAMIEEATVDAYDDSEQASGFLACFEQIAVPFTTEVLGGEVSVTGFDLTDDEALVAICRRGKAKQCIPVLDLQLPTPPPEGHDWIAAYRRWRKGR
ncbi:hypothetical protein LBMAG53_35100 [Planctomycetota bacterium]|nr:hypothetical protein LBMAG53_35100 [Planctomycetota bacterium]